MPISQNEAKAVVTDSGRGAAIWELLRHKPPEKEKLELEDELNTLVTAYMNTQVEIEKTEVDLYDVAYNVALAQGVRRSALANELFKSVAVEQRRAHESDEMALDRLYSEQPGYYRVVKMLHDAEQRGAARRVKIEKGFREGFEPHRELEAKAVALRKADPLLSFAQCVDEVLEKDLELADRVFAAERGDP